MVRTNNLKVSSLTPIIAPAELKQVFPLAEKKAEFVMTARKHVQNIIFNRDPRLMVVVGPCSIHDPDAAIDYARKLARLSKDLDDQLFIVMRVYFEKPRTTIGWKGLINDPDLDGTHQISKGLGVARNLLCRLTDLELPVATEMLDPITPQYMSDLISWGAIGARTTESQVHREMASGLSFPVGFKNGTDGSLQIALDAMKSALHPHNFLGISSEGKTAIVKTTGNSDVHIVLRGGNNGPNYRSEDIKSTEQMLEKAGLEAGIMVDCSHANSNKNHEKQPEVLAEVIRQITAGNSSINSVMVESNLKAGNQPMADSLENLEYGVSITDKCVDWETTEKMLRDTHAELKKIGGRNI
ncbi:MAG: 3-deoxy-7-phosphoheptulonate synthase [Desulfuromonas sp.]|nr:MAG: 3-deoxy-7-phosphoheptulonate synthase [Desulfuromonas sp.]